jgi:hypothetical protein
LENCTTTSKEPSELLNFERDLPTTPADVAAQRRLRAPRPLTFEGYLRFLASFEPASYDDLRSKRGPSGDGPFELIPSGALPQRGSYGSTS